MPGLVDTVESFDPAGGFFQINAEFLGFSFTDFDFSPLAVGMMRFVIDNHEILVAGQLA